MEILDFGGKNAPIIILIHGFQCPYQVWDKYINYYKTRYHIIVPILPGHSQKQKEEYISVEKAATEIEKYVISNFGERVHCVFGMSMGGVLAAQLLKNHTLKIENVVFDGSPLVPVNGLVRKYMTSFYLKVTHKTQKRDCKTLKQARKMIVPENCFEPFLLVMDNMSDETIIRSIEDVTRFAIPADMVISDTKIYYFHGSAINEMIAKKTAKYLKKHFPNVVIKCFNGMGHCEVSLFHSEKMIEELKNVCGW